MSVDLLTSSSECYKIETLQNILYLYGRKLCINMYFSNIYIDLFDKLFKQLCIISYIYIYIYIYIVYSFYEDNNRILVIFSMWFRKIDVAKSVKII